MLSHVWFKKREPEFRLPKTKRKIRLEGEGSPQANLA